MTRLAPLFLLLLAAPSFALAAERCDWQSIVHPEDRPTVQVSLTELSAVEQAPASDGISVSDEAQDRQDLHDLLQRAANTLPLGDVAGAWRVRSLQLDRGHVFGYPYFAARITRQGCSLHFAKTTGSQRRSGELLPLDHDGRALAFLGVATVNDEVPRPYGTLDASSDDHNSVGRLLRIGPNELLMILDYRQGSFELYHLKR